jgi:hypothetical protein
VTTEAIADRVDSATPRCSVISARTGPSCAPRSGGSVTGRGRKQREIAPAPVAGAERSMQGQRTAESAVLAALAASMSMALTAATAFAAHARTALSGGPVVVAHLLTHRLAFRRIHAAHPVLHLGPEGVAVCFAHLARPHLDEFLVRQRREVAGQRARGNSERQQRSGKDQFRFHDIHSFVPVWEH